MQNIASMPQLVKVNFLASTDIESIFGDFFKLKNFDYWSITVRLKWQSIFRNPGLTSRTILSTRRLAHLYHYRMVPAHLLDTRGAPQLAPCTQTLMSSHKCELESGYRGHMNYCILTSRTTHQDRILNTIFIIFASSFFMTFWKEMAHFFEMDNNV